MSDDTHEEPPPLLGRGETVPRRRWKWLLPLLVAAAVSTLVAVGATVILDEDRGAPRAVVDRYLDNVAKGDTVAAYSLLCDRFRTAKPFSDFTRTLQIEKLEAGGVPEHKIGREEKVPGDKNQRRVSYTVRRMEGKVIVDVIVDAALVREQGRWRICGFKTRGPAK